MYTPVQVLNKTFSSLNKQKRRGQASNGKQLSDERGENQKPKNQ